VEILRRPGEAVVVRRISRFVLAVDQAHDIIRVPLVVDVALLPGDDIIGWRQKSEQVLEMCRIIENATKRTQLHGMSLSSQPIAAPPSLTGRGQVGD
jgi:hypothetical protein